MPSADASGSVTRLLHRMRRGDAEAFDQLMPLVYEELRRVAANVLREEAGTEALDTTALVHEVYLKMIGQTEVDWQNRAHFFCLAGRAMRQVLVDHARRRKAQKRGGGWRRTTLSGKGLGVTMDVDELLTLDDALDQLAERQRRVVECRFFGGMTEEEVAEALGVSRRTVQRDWTKARAWLNAALYE